MVMSDGAIAYPTYRAKMSDTKNGILDALGDVKRTQKVNGVKIHYIENIHTKKVYDFKYKD